LPTRACRDVSSASADYADCADSEWIVAGGLLLLDAPAYRSGFVLLCVHSPNWSDETGKIKAVIGVIGVIGGCPTAVIGTRDTSK
jgi:hypothetical protein